MHQKNTDTLPSELAIHEYVLKLPTCRTFSDHVASLAFDSVSALQLLSNASNTRFEGLPFVNNNGIEIACAYFKKNMSSESIATQQVSVHHYLLAGLFTSDLDYLAKFFGH